MKTIIMTSLAAIAVSLTAAACGQADPVATTPLAPTTTAAEVVERPSGTVDELVTIGNGRMHLRCAGTGASTVLLLAGWDEDGTSWATIEPPLVETTRVCSYSRFGTGTSDPPPGPQTFTSQAADLHALLDEAGEPGPYVVVGHSFGGPQAVAFTSQHPDEVVGLMLLDASPPTWPTTICSVAEYEALCTVMHDPALDQERLDAIRAFDAVAAIDSLGDVPMTVMSAAHRADATLPPAELVRLDAAWARGVEQWASLSTASSIVTVEHTGHHIQLDQPAAVIDAVAALLP